VGAQELRPGLHLGRLAGDSGLDGFSRQVESG
jgi:hypothetical protein